MPRESEVTKVSPEAQAAWVEYEPVGELTEGMKLVRISTMIRHAFLSGFEAGERAK